MTGSGNLCKAIETCQSQTIDQARTKVSAASAFPAGMHYHNQPLGGQSTARSPSAWLVMSLGRITEGTGWGKSASWEPKSVINDGQDLQVQL